jgi:hypothetical protein
MLWMIWESARTAACSFEQITVALAAVDADALAEEDRTRAPSYSISRLRRPGATRWCMKSIRFDRQDFGPSERRAALT